MKHVLVNRLAALHGGLYMVDKKNPEMRFVDTPQPYVTFEEQFLSATDSTDRVNFVRSHKESMEKDLPYEAPYLTFFWFFMPDGTSVSLYLKCEDKNVITYFEHLWGHNG